MKIYLICVHDESSITLAELNTVKSEDSFGSEVFIHIGII